MTNAMIIPHVKESLASIGSARSMLFDAQPGDRDHKAYEAFVAARHALYLAELEVLALRDLLTAPST